MAKKLLKINGIDLEALFNPNERQYKYVGPAKTSADYIFFIQAVKNYMRANLNEFNYKHFAENLNTKMTDRRGVEICIGDEACWGVNQGRCSGGIRTGRIEEIKFEILSQSWARNSHRPYVNIQFKCVPDKEQNSYGKSVWKPWSEIIVLGE
jgi:hypothetical protein